MSSFASHVTLEVKTSVKDLQGIDAYLLESLFNEWKKEHSNGIAESLRSTRRLETLCSDRWPQLSTREACELMSEELRTRVEPWGLFHPWPEVA